VTLAPGDDRLNVALCTREFPPDVYSPRIAKRHQHNIDITGSQRIMTNGQRDTRCLTWTGPPPSQYLLWQNNFDHRKAMSTVTPLSEEW